jgi:hypothetical protein
MAALSGRSEDLQDLECSERSPFYFPWRLENKRYHLIYYDHQAMEADAPKSATCFPAVHHRHYTRRI